MIPIASPQLGQEEQAAASEVIASGHIASGPRVAAFEKAFAEYVGTAHAVATSNGTTALHAALEAMGVGHKDEVIIPAFTFIATANAVLYAGGRPVLVDVEPSTFTLDPSRLERAVTERTKVIIPVQLYGQAAEMGPIRDFAEDRDIRVLGDAAQAHGAKQGGQMVGALADAETFSFYPTKNMTSGEGGMVTTDDAELADRVRSIVNHGRAEAAHGTYDHLRRGHNFRLSDIHAAVGLVQLDRLPAFNERRMANAARYDEAFAKLKTIRPPKVGIGNTHCYHQYTLVCQERGIVMDTLRARDIGFGVYYPRAIHQYPHLEQYGHSRLENAMRLANQVLSIPVHPALSDEDVKAVIEAVQAADEATLGAA